MSQIHNILFYGGSITCGCGASDYKNAWASLLFQKLQTILPGPLKMFNAAISGTGSVFGSARLSTHVLPCKPDLVFVEFSVNDYYQTLSEPDRIRSSMESIVRDLKENNPDIAIIFLYTTVGGKNGSNIHHEIAAHYGIFEIDCQAALQKRIDEGCSWSDFLPDNVHPNDEGHRIYAETAFREILSHPECFSSIKDGIVPYCPSSPKNNLCLFRKEDILESKGFVFGDSFDFAVTLHLESLRLKNAVRSENPGDYFVTEFTGTGFSLYNQISLHGGMISVEVDGQLQKEGNFFYPYTKDTPEYVLFYSLYGLENKKHTLKITVLENQDERSSGHLVSIAGLITETI